MEYIDKVYEECKGRIIVAVIKGIKEIQGEVSGFRRIQLGAIYSKQEGCLVSGGLDIYTNHVSLYPEDGPQWRDLREPGRDYYEGFSLRYAINNLDFPVVAKIAEGLIEYKRMKE